MSAIAPSLARRQLFGDVLLAAAMTALSLTIITTMPGLPWAAYGLALAHTLPLAVRRRMPTAAVSVALVAALAFALAGLPMIGLGLAGVVWLYSIGSELDRPRSLVFLAVAEGVLFVMIRVGNQGDLSTLVGDTVVLAVAFLLGDSARRRRQLLALHRDRADQLERTQSEVARRAVAEERLRTARELHDIVAHSMSIIAVQAGTGRLAIETDPEQTRDALMVIEETTRDALGEMRRLLGVLRGSDESELVRTPSPTLDSVADLIARTEAAGVPVDIEVRGERRPLPAGMELAAYRILQEALTNVTRHAAGTRAQVVLAYRGEGLTIEVSNPDGGQPTPPASDGGAGLGIAGMRERAALYGGFVAAGPLPGGGFRVTADLCSAE